MMSGASRKLTEPSTRNPSLCHIRLSTGEICPQSCKGEGICHNQPPRTSATRVVSNDSLDPSSKGIRASQCFKPGDLITAFETSVICDKQLVHELDSLWTRIQADQTDRPQYSVRHHLGDKVFIDREWVRSVWAIPSQDVTVWWRMGASSNLRTAMQLQSVFQGHGAWAEHSCCDTCRNSEIVFLYREEGGQTQFGTFLQATRHIPEGARVTTSYGDIRDWNMSCRCCRCRKAHDGNNDRGESWVNRVFAEDWRRPARIVQKTKYKVWRRVWTTQGQWTISSAQVQGLINDCICQPVVDAMLNWCVHGSTAEHSLHTIAGDDVAVVPSTVWGKWAEALANVRSPADLASTFKEKGAMTGAADIDLRALRLILIPILRNHHWILVVIFVRLTVMCLFDSLSSHSSCEAGEISARVWVWLQLTWQQQHQRANTIPRPLWSLDDAKFEAMLQQAGIPIAFVSPQHSRWRQTLGVVRRDDIEGSIWMWGRRVAVPTQKDSVSCALFVIAFAIGVSRDWITSEGIITSALTRMHEPSWAKHMRSWTFQVLWANTELGTDVNCALCGKNLSISQQLYKEGAVRCRKMQDCGKRKKALSAGSQTDRIVLDSTPEPEGEEDTVIPRVNEQAILDGDPPVNSSRPRTWRNFGNTCYISSVSQLLSNAPEFQRWCSVNGVINIPTLAADPDTVQRYITWTRSVGLQTQSDGRWQPNDPLSFFAHLCSVLSQGREAASLLEIFKIASELHTVCLVCRTNRQIPHLQPYLTCPHWANTLQNTLDNSFAVCVAISRCDFCHGDTIHTTRLQPKCYPPQLLVCIRQNTSMSSYLHRDGAPVDTPRKITTSHDNLFSRYGLGCFHPKRFPNHFVEEGEDDDDEVARIQLTQRAWESSIDAIASFEGTAWSKCAFCHNISRLVICRCGWIKDMALWQVQWNTTHCSTIRHCVACLRWIPTYTWSTTSTKMARELLISSNMWTSHGTFDKGMSNTFHRDKCIRTPLVDAVLNWILTLTPHTDHKGRCKPPRSIVGQRFQMSGHTRSSYEVTGAIGHRHVQDNTGRSQGHFWAELQWQGQAVTLDEIIDSLPGDNTYMFMGSRSARWMSNPSDTDHDTVPGR